MPAGRTRPATSTARPRDISKVAIVKATIDRIALNHLELPDSIDPFIFRSGVVTVQPGHQSDVFHGALRLIEHVL